MADLLKEKREEFNRYAASVFPRLTEYEEKKAFLQETFAMNPALLEQYIQDLDKEYGDIIDKYNYLFDQMNAEQQKQVASNFADPVKRAEAEKQYDENYWSNVDESLTWKPKVQVGYGGGTRRKRYS